MSLNGNEKKRWKVWLSLSNPLFSLQVGMATEWRWIGERDSFFRNHTMHSYLGLFTRRSCWRSSTKLGRNTRVIVFVLTLLPTTREKGDEHCVRLPHVYSNRTPYWMEALWKITQYTFEWWSILQTSQRSSHEDFDELKFKNEQLCGLK